EEIMVRDPVRLIKNELLCVGCVPVNTMIYILHGRRKFIIEAACLAGEQSGVKLKNTTTNPMGLAIVFDCISRALYLGDDFSEELLALNAGVGEGKKTVGILSIGEIANTDRGTINLLNKSIVVGQI
ncbi:MAG TPA: FIST C-terminal domain-containing protein, partial [Cellvibrio sp.]